MILHLTGRIDSSNAEKTEQALRAQLPAEKESIVLDAQELEYLSSAGLRVILRLKKDFGDVEVKGCNPDVYDIFEMTGFTEMMTISRAYRTLSIDGCKVLGEGSNGIVYRTDPDTIVKVYKSPDSLEEIHNERELARKAFIMGIPTAIPYDVVKVGDCYGSVFELLNATSFAGLIADGEDIDSLARQSIDILKTIHAITLSAGELPSKKQEALKWATFCQAHLPEDIGARLLQLTQEIPEECTMLHGDFHVNNIMRQGNENLLIDMDTLSLGHPIFELSQMYLAYLGFSEIDRKAIERFLGITHEQAVAFWNSSLKYYFEGKEQAWIDDVVNKARVLGYTRLLRRTIKREPSNKEMIANCTEKLCELVPVTDKLFYENI